MKSNSNPKQKSPDWSVPNPKVRGQVVPTDRLAPPPPPIKKNDSTK